MKPSDNNPIKLAKNIKSRYRSGGEAARALLSLGLRPGEPTAASLRGTGPARGGLLALERTGISAGVLTPIEVASWTARLLGAHHRILPER
ncbi:MAG TPA: hypothetical protein VE776_15340 [Actinomycetota bacterium]|nr:hypothetical protein [Actinomycetota bacterium]